MRDTIFTNVGLTPDGDVWWEGKSDAPPEGTIDWHGNVHDPSSGEKVAHPNSRFCAPMANNPALSKKADDPDGVPISAIIFGGRRPTTMPLVYQAFNWSHGVYVGATMGSEVTAAAIGLKAGVRRDPMAMLPFCGYNMAEYFHHWLDMRDKVKDLPRFFHVNWFRLDENGKFLWPGFGQNMRVLEWIVKRCKGVAAGHETPIGWTPHIEDFNLEGLEGFTEEQFDQCMAYNPEEWADELIDQAKLFFKLYDLMPKELVFQRELLAARLT
jgi:phosphoenolpyruvate carboxykinase (GTP)